MSDGSMSWNYERAKARSTHLDEFDARYVGKNPNHAAPYGKGPRCAYSKAKPKGYAGCTRDKGHPGPCAMPLLPWWRSFAALRMHLNLLR